MTCPACKTDNGITDSVSSGGLVTRSVCPDVFHVSPAERLPPTATTASEAPRGLPDASKDSRLEHPYTTPIPVSTQNGASGFVWCNACEKPQPTSGHECRDLVGQDADDYLRWLETGESPHVARAEFAEDLLNRLAFVHGCEHMGLYDLDPSDLAREPTRSNIARGGWVWALCDAGECPFCDAARKP